MSTRSSRSKSRDREEEAMEEVDDDKPLESESKASTSSMTRTRPPRVAAVKAKKRIIMKVMELTSSSSEEDSVVENVQKKKYKTSKESTPELDNDVDQEGDDGSGDEEGDDGSGNEEGDGSVDQEEEEVDPWAALEREDSTRAQSPNVPSGQYEIEDVLDYVKDEVGDMYLIKWKKWSHDFNTWEPPANLVNCDEELLNFYRQRKAEMEEILENSEYVEIAGGKRRRKGPPMVHVPPDPRPFEVRVKEFCDVTKPISEEEIQKVYPEWNKKFNVSKGKDKGIRWTIGKVNKFLQEGVDGKLNTDEMDALRQELLYIEIDRRKTVLSESLKTWQAKMNYMTKEKPYISVENVVDFEGPPEGFEFVNDYVPSAGITIPCDPPVGCSCNQSCYDNRNTCCAKQFGSSFAYTKYRKVAVAVGTPIYECNRKCKCGPECPNRVVQDGQNEMKLSIFRTNNGCGWGVKTLKSIKRGCFVTLYVGEVVFADGAEERAKKDGHSYLFDLDFNDQENPLYSVDASKFGNVAHFINHSCNPNLCVYAVWIDCLDPNLPKLAMFANRDIAKGEEISFDYTDQLSSDSHKTATADDTTEESPVKDRKKCLCGAEKCRKYIF